MPPSWSSCHPLGRSGTLRADTRSGEVGRHSHPHCNAVCPCLRPGIRWTARGLYMDTDTRGQYPCEATQATGGRGFAFPPTLVLLLSAHPAPETLCHSLQGPHSAPPPQGPLHWLPCHMPPTHCLLQAAPAICAPAAPVLLNSELRAILRGRGWAGPWNILHRAVCLVVSTERGAFPCQRGTAVPGCRRG